VGSSYILEEPIGRGATGTVWRAVDRSTGERVAVKLLREDLMRQPKAITRFVQERAILLMLRHEYIVRVRDLLTVGDSLGLVMDLVDSGSLRDRLVDCGTMDPSAAASLLAQVAAALARAHTLGVVHRDLKPDNILLDCVDGLTARLTDFGIARVLDAPGLTTPEALIGTPNYMAPELINGGRAAPPADVYALGVVLYELVVGRQPYAGGGAVAVLRRHLDAAPRRYPGIPDAVWSVIEACLDKNPDRRPPAAELVTTLRSLARKVEGVPALVPRSADTPTPTPGPGGADRQWTGLAADLIPDPRRSPEERRKPLGSWRRLRFLGIVLLVTASSAAALTGFGGTRLLGLNRNPDGGPTRSAGPRGSAADPGLSPAPLPSGASAPAGSPTGTTVPHAAVAASVGPGRAEADVRVFGPWQCTNEYRSDLGHPVLAKPCYAVGADVRVMAHMQAVPGVQADVSIIVEDADTGTQAAGPYTCDGMMFTDFAPEHSCGPFELDLPHGHRYVVVQKWQYTGRGVLPGGTARGPLFTW
jgi:serine/threonine-protein kinase